MIHGGYCERRVFCVFIMPLIHLLIVWFHLRAWVCTTILVKPVYYDSTKLPLARAEKTSFPGNIFFTTKLPEVWRHNQDGCAHEFWTFDDLCTTVRSQTRFADTDEINNPCVFRNCFIFSFWIVVFCCQFHFVFICHVSCTKVCCSCMSTGKIA